MSLYHMYVAGFGPPEAMIFRGTHLLFALTLVFLLYPLEPGGGAGWRVARRRCCSALGWAFMLHIFLNYESLHQPHHLHRRPDASATSSSPWSRC